MRILCVSVQYILAIAIFVQYMDADHDYGVAENEHEMNGDEREDAKCTHEDKSEDNTIRTQNNCKRPFSMQVYCRNDEEQHAMFLLINMTMNLLMPEARAKKKDNTSGGWYREPSAHTLRFRELRIVAFHSSAT